MIKRSKIQSKHKIYYNRHGTSSKIQFNIRINRLNGGKYINKLRKGYIKLMFNKSIFHIYVSLFLICDSNKQYFEWNRNINKTNIYYRTSLIRLLIIPTLTFYSRSPTFYITIYPTSILLLFVNRVYRGYPCCKVGEGFGVVLFSNWWRY